jgi:alpha-tubulin suppressor-like RCC1 family protein
MRYKFQLALGLICAVAIPAQSAPNWWSDPDYRLIDSNQTTSDNALVLQGQAKQAFAASKSYFDDELIQFGGAGEGVDALFSSTIFTNSDYDYHVLLNGQLKALAHPFYLRLDELGIPLSLVGFGPDYTGEFPWTDDDLSDDADNSPALIGQVKYVYSFDLSLSQDGDSIPDWWEYIFAIDPSVNIDNTTTDSDGDLRLDLTEYNEKTNPTDYYDGMLPSLTIVSGDGQTVVSGVSAADPIVVRVDGTNANPLENAPLEVSVSPLSSGTIQVNNVLLTPGTSIRTDSAGEVAVDFTVDDGFFGEVVRINFLARSGNQQAVVQALLNVLQQPLSFSLFAGVYQTYALKNESISGAGLNRTGQIPGQSEILVDQFSTVSGLPSGIVKMTGGADHVLALTADGFVYSWGDNFSGQLGLGSFDAVSTPTQVALAGSVIDVATGDGFSCFLVDAGSGAPVLYLAGDLRGLNAGDQLEATPVSLDMSDFSGSPLLEVAASGRRILVRDSGGAVWAWGDNRFGQSDPGRSEFSLSSPVQIVSENATGIYASPDASLALLENGSLLGWGNSSFGQLGAISTESRAPVTLATNVVHAAVGNGFVAYVTGANELYTAGLNHHGQLGRDTASAQIASVDLVTLLTIDGIMDLAVGDRHLIYLTNSNENPLYGFGDNRFGALGEGSAPKVSTPTLLTHNL